MAAKGYISVLKAGELLGVSHTAVQKAIAGGRLVDSVVMVNGKAKILPEKIKAEWEANTEPSVSRVQAAEVDGEAEVEAPAPEPKAKKPKKEAKAPASPPPVPAQPSAPAKKPAASDKPITVDVPTARPGELPLAPGIPPVKKLLPVGNQGQKGRTQTTFNENRTDSEFFKAENLRLDYEQRIGELVTVRDVKDEAFKVGRIIREGMLALPERLAAQLAAETDPHTIHSVMTQEITQVLEELVSANAGK